MGHISAKKWVIFGLCWIVLLAVVTVAAKVGERIGPASAVKRVESSGRSEQLEASAWAEVQPPFEVPKISFHKLSSDQIFDSEKLLDFEKNLETHVQYKIVIEGIPATTNPDDRQLAADRAAFVTQQLIGFGLDKKRILDDASKIGPVQPGRWEVKLKVQEFQKKTSNK